MPHGARAFPLLLLAAALASGACRSARRFQVSGTITLSAGLQAKAPRQNAVLFIIAKNRGGVPVAVRRIVNPEFPVIFTLRDEDLIVPGSLPADPLILQVQLNAHGRVGKAEKGDLEGENRELALPGERGVHIVIDREL